jgi:uncharacterized protein (DUF885 family)
MSYIIGSVRLTCLVPIMLLLQQLAVAQPLADFFKQTFEERLRDDPEFATSIGRHDYGDRWTDRSPTGRAQRRAHLERRLEQLKAFPVASLTGQDRLTVRLLQYDFRSRLEADEVETYLLPVGQLLGFHNSVYRTIDRMPARTVGDYFYLLARLKVVSVYVGNYIALLEQSIARGITQPRVVVDLVADQVAAQIRQDSSSTPLLAAFRRFPPQIPQMEQNRLRAAAVEAYDQQFLPAWRMFLDYLRNEYMPKVRPRDSVSSMTGGREAYAIMVRRYTTTNMTPQTIHKLGEEEVARLEAEMQTLIAKAGFTGTIAEFEQQLASSPAQHFQTKDEMLAYCRNVAKIIEPELPNQFRKIPVLLYGIRPIPPDREAAEASNAQIPTPDYSAPGWFNLNTFQPEKQVKYTKESLVLHEAVPGHIFQVTLAQALEGVPDIRRFYASSAYEEGWALYVESLGSQLGVYSDSYSRFGQLANERFRAVRLVVDTGVHEDGWTREQAVEYFRQHAPDVSLAEIDRYISWPAQALSYKIGQLKIRQLRTLAEQQLGARFDVRDFHDVVLRNGTLPLELLEEEVREYIRAAASR